MNVPYRLIGGVNFYQRKEIKDMIAYLKTIDNGLDDLSVKRIINVPKRGIGATSEGRIDTYAEVMNLSFYDACCRADEVPGIGKAAVKFAKFTELITRFRQAAETEDVAELIEDVLHESGYMDDLLQNEDDVEGRTRLENIEELRNKAVDYCRKAGEPSLSGFLEEVALIADIDSMDDSDNRIVLMTLHGAKGLEFPVVYLAGLEDGLFPSMMSINSGELSDIEEERRLCYVGITRARNELIMSAAKLRMVNGETHMSKVSRFVYEIPAHMLEENRSRSSYSSGHDSDSDFSSGGGYGGSRYRSGGYGSYDGNYGGGSYADSGYSRSNSGYGYSSSYVKSERGNTADYALGGSGYSNSYGKGFLTGTGKYNGRPDFDNDDKGQSIMLGRDFTANKAKALEYAVNDRVKHFKFGEGTVLSINEQKKDFEVTVDFDKAGVKKMYAAFAKLRKLD